MRKDKTEEVYDFLLDYMLEHDYPPSVMEIARSLYMHRNTVSYHLKKLDKMGSIVYSKHGRISLTGVRYVIGREREV